MTTDRDQLREALAVAGVLRHSVITFGGVEQTKLGEKAAALLTALATPDQAVMAERERCARIAEEEAAEANRGFQTGQWAGAIRIAAAIRAQGEKK